ncbi:hypothetical protein [Planomonospora algeriensis]
MDSPITTPETTAPETAVTASGEAATADLVTSDVPQFEDDAARWKYYSRLNESRFKEAKQELEATTAKATELEQALSSVQEQHTLSLASIEIKHAAERQGIALDDEAISALNLSVFIADGQVNASAISDFLSRFGTAKPHFSQALGIGSQAGSVSGPVTRDQLRGMKPADIVQAAREGRIEGQKH